MRREPSDLSSKALLLNSWQAPSGRSYSLPKRCLNHTPRKNMAIAPQLDWLSSSLPSLQDLRAATPRPLFSAVHALRIPVLRSLTSGLIKPPSPPAALSQLLAVPQTRLLFARFSHLYIGQSSIVTTTFLWSTGSCGVASPCTSCPLPPGSSPPTRCAAVWAPRVQQDAACQGCGQRVQPQLHLHQGAEIVWCR